MLCSMKGAGWVMMHGLLLAALVLLAAGPAEAQYPGAPYQASPYRTAPPGSPFAAPAAPALDINLTQRGIPAEATAADGVQARQRALAAGRRTAWERALSEAGLPPTNLSDERIEDLVASIVIEQERILPTRYSGRITVVFNPNRVREALGRGGVPGSSPPSITATPASNWVDAVAIYRSMGEWLELRRRLLAAGPVASVDITGIAVDGARLRLGLRAPAQVAADELAALGIALEPAAGTQPGHSWRLGLAGG
jgi:hypothetical protein